MSDPVQWPEQIVAAAGDDLSTPVVKLLRDTHLLTTKKSASGASSDTDPDWSAVAIESDATNISKLVGGGIAAAGGLSVVAGAIAAFWNVSDGAVRLVVVGGAAVLLAASAVALAIVMRADVTARAQAAAARSEARGMVIRAFLDNAAAATAGGYVAQRRTDSGWVPVVSFGHDAQGVAITALGGDILHDADVTALITWPPPPPA
jgi:hypothetical protein